MTSDAMTDAPNPLREEVARLIAYNNCLLMHPRDTGRAECQANNGWDLWLEEADAVLAIVARETAAAERRATAAIVAWLRDDATKCDCAAHSEGECACGAWSDYKRVTQTDVADAIERCDHMTPAQKDGE